VIHLQASKSSSLLEFAIVPVPGLNSEKFTLAYQLSRWTRGSKDPSL
jgi:hypothetical protein